ncbi:hypothetical protein [Fodinibius sp.]|uniref:tetratricopeptide repeat protein n=1 Tax=Fodinibius sp. TaxID=1872440 RepID=UPI002ACEB424|nr:hypothetical protein [Fodinibius sp.]MDZ7660070.1 hypothetical protein [Fodinibius sp.]
MDEITKVLNKGIEAKREGNYSRALEYYSKAQEIDPLDSRSYGNSMKVLIGTGNYELAFRNLLVLCHFNIIQRLYNQDPMAEQVFLKNLFRFQWSSNTVTDTQIKLTDSQIYEPTLVFVGLKKNDSLKDLIFRADNLTFYMGHCYVGDLNANNDSILEQFGKNSESFKNMNKSVLGKPSGSDFRDSSKEGYFLSIGFIYAHLNINFSLKSEEEIVQYYLNPENKIRKDIWNYRQFIDS